MLNLVKFLFVQHKRFIIGLRKRNSVENFLYYLNF